MNPTKLSSSVTSYVFFQGSVGLGLRLDGDGSGGTEPIMCKNVNLSQVSLNCPLFYSIWYPLMMVLFTPTPSPSIPVCNSLVKILHDKLAVFHLLNDKKIHIF